jgi:hypothetical protein
MELVVAQLIQYPDQNQQATGHSDRQPGNVDKGITLMSSHVSHCDLKVVSEHNSSPSFLID